MRFATRAVHAGLEPDPTYGSVIPPIHQTSTYAQRAPGEFVEDFDYSRSANPTRAALERALGELEGGLGSAFSSGMAATHALLTAAAQRERGDEDVGTVVARDRHFDDRGFPVEPHDLVGQHAFALDGEPVRDWRGIETMPSHSVQTSTRTFGTRSRVPGMCTVRTS